MANYNFRSSVSLPPIVKNLIIINALAFVAKLVFERQGLVMEDLFALHHYKADVFRPYQIITHMFMHANFFHLLFNMFALWMFGAVVERLWGPKKFLIFYLICGFGAALAQMGSYIYEFWPYDHAILSPEMAVQYQEALRLTATVGASGAIMGVLAAFGFLFPNTQLYIMPFPFPVKAKWAVMGFIALDVFGGFARLPGDNIAHFAHVGGALIGLLLVLFWNKRYPQTF